MIVLLSQDLENCIEKFSIWYLPVYIQYHYVSGDFAIGMLQSKPCFESRTIGLLFYIVCRHCKFTFKCSLITISERTASQYETLICSERNFFILPIIIWAFLPKVIYSQKRKCDLVIERCGCQPEKNWENIWIYIINK